MSFLLNIGPQPRNSPGSDGIYEVSIYIIEIFFNLLKKYKEEFHCWLKSGEKVHLLKNLTSCCYCKLNKNEEMIVAVNTIYAIA